MIAPLAPGTRVWLWPRGIQPDMRKGWAELALQVRKFSGTVTAPA